MLWGCVFGRVLQELEEFFDLESLEFCHKAVKLGNLYDRLWGMDVASGSPGSMGVRSRGRLTFPLQEGPRVFTLLSSVPANFICYILVFTVILPISLGAIVSLCPVWEIWLVKHSIFLNWNTWMLSYWSILLLCIFFLYSTLAGNWVV